MATHALTSRRYASPVGELTLVASDAGLRAILWPDDARTVPGTGGASARTRPDAERSVPGTAGVSAKTPPDAERSAHRVLDATASWLDAYFAGGPTPATPPLDLVGTEFQRSVWAALAEVSPGTTTTYGALAAAVGRPTAARAVGAAVGRNPVSVLLGCHRVVGSTGTLTGFAGGLPTKQWLLAHEATS